jgi:hypothetical protein
MTIFAVVAVAVAVAVVVVVAISTMVVAGGPYSGFSDLGAYPSSCIMATSSPI